MSEDINEAWLRGYTDGYKSVTGRIPSIPPRPGSIPAGVADPVEYFYQQGYKLGKQNGEYSK